MSAEDEIRNTLAQYCLALDGRDPETYISLFSHNCQLHTANHDRIGRQGIKEHTDDVYAQWPAGLRTKHTLGSSVIKVHGDSADAVSSVVVFRSLDDGPWEVGQAGLYIDKFIREEGEWRFLDRRIQSDHAILPGIKRL